MSKNDEELEFISVSADEDNELNTYMDPSAPEANSSQIGNWILNQSKVSKVFSQLLCFYRSHYFNFLTYFLFVFLFALSIQSRLFSTSCSSRWLSLSTYLDRGSQPTSYLPSSYVLFYWHLTSGLSRMCREDCSLDCAGGRM